MITVPTPPTMNYLLIIVLGAIFLAFFRFVSTLATLVSVVVIENFISAFFRVIRFAFICLMCPVIFYLFHAPILANYLKQVNTPFK